MSVRLERRFPCGAAAAGAVGSAMDGTSAGCSAVSGVRATVVFDYPTTAAVAGYLREALLQGGGAAGGDAEEEKLRRVLASTALSRFRDAGILDALLRLADPEGAAAESSGERSAEEIDELDAESLVRLALDAEGAGH